MGAPLVSSNSLCSVKIIRPTCASRLKCVARTIIRIEQKQGAYLQKCRRLHACFKAKCTHHIELQTLGWLLTVWCSQQGKNCIVAVDINNLHFNVLIGLHRSLVLNNNLSRLGYISYRKQKFVGYLNFLLFLAY